MHGTELLTLPVLGLIAWEDLRERSIHWWWLPLLLLGLWLPYLQEGRGAEQVHDAVFNLAYLGLQLTGVLLLMLLRHRRWLNPLRHFIGLGDLLFFVVLACGLSCTELILFQLSGLALCVPAYLLLARWRPAMHGTVPLAGFLAIYLGLWQLWGSIGLDPLLAPFADQLVHHG